MKKNKLMRRQGIYTRKMQHICALKIELHAQLQIFKFHS